MNPLGKLNNNFTICLAVAVFAAIFGKIFLVIVDSNLKWAIYFFLGPIPLFLLYKTQSSVLKVASVVFVLIFMEGIFIFQRPLQKELLPFVLVSLSLVFCLVVIFSFFNEKHTLPKLGNYNLTWFVFFISVGVSLTIGCFKDPSVWIGELRQFQVYYLEFFIFFILGCLSFNNSSDINKFFSVMFFIGAIVAAGHLFSITTRINFETIRGGVSAARDLSDEANWRYGGFFGNPNTMAALYVMLIPSAIVNIVKNKGSLRKAVGVVFLTLMFVSLFLSGSRGGILFGCINLLFALWLIGLKKKEFVFSFLIMGVLTVFAYLIMEANFGSFLQGTLNRVSEKGMSNDIRLDIWYYSILILFNNPLGIGLYWKEFIELLGRYGNLYFAGPHNLYISIAVKVGWIGLVSFLIIVFQPLVKGIRNNFKTSRFQDRLALQFSIISIMGFLLCGMTEGIFNNGFKLNHIFGLVLGILTSLNYRLDRESSFLSKKTIKHYAMDLKKL